MINLLLLNNFYPVIWYRRVRRKKKATNYCIRFGRSLWSANQLPAHVENFLPQIATFPQFYVYLNVTQAKRMISLLLNNFYPVISYRRARKKKKATNYCIRSGRSLWSANQLPAQGFKYEIHGFSDLACTTTWMDLRPNDAIWGLMSFS